MAMRLFIAVELPENWTAAMAGIQEALRRRGAGGLRWVRSEGIHLTLKFLGNVEQERVAPVTDAMRGAAAACAPFTLRLGPPGAFGAPRRVRVVWAGVAGDLDALTTLWRAVEDRVSPLGYPPERDRFSPHLTLARVPDDMPTEARSRIPALLDALHLPDPPPLRVREIALMQSLLGPGGARYQRVATAPLREDYAPRGASPAPRG
jgi:2'-5' RNA ligase